MTVMITEVYDALMSASADEAKARAVAATLAAYDDKFASIERRLDWCAEAALPERHDGGPVGAAATAPEFREYDRRAGRP